MPTFHVGSLSSQLRSLAKLAVIPLHDFKHRFGERWAVGNQQAKVVDGASDMFVELFGEAGRHSRSAPGMADLPRNPAVIVDCVIEIAAG